MDWRLALAHLTDKSNASQPILTHLIFDTTHLTVDPTHLTAHNEASKLTKQPSHEPHHLSLISLHIAHRTT